MKSHKNKPLYLPFENTATEYTKTIVYWWRSKEIPENVKPINLYANLRIPC